MQGKRSRGWKALGSCAFYRYCHCRRPRRPPHEFKFFLLFLLWFSSFKTSRSCSSSWIVPSDVLINCEARSNGEPHGEHKPRTIKGPTRILPAPSVEAGFNFGSSLILPSRLLWLNINNRLRMRLEPRRCSVVADADPLSLPDKVPNKLCASEGFIDWTEVRFPLSYRRRRIEQEC